MATLEKEIFESRSYRRTENGYEANRSYLVSGATDEKDALTASGLPTYGGAYGVGSPAANMKARDISAAPVSGSKGWFQVDVRWDWKFSTSDTEPEDGTELWEINGTGDTIHADSCLSQTTYGDEAQDVGVAVGVDDDGNVTGADIFEAVVTISVRLWKTTANVNTAYIAGLVGSLQKVNSTTWYGLNAGECLFNRFRVAKTQDLLTEIEFEFLGRRNLSSGDVPEFLDKDGAQITVTSGKDGWQYLWAQPGQTVDESGSGGDAKNKTYTRGVYVSDFYKTSNYSALGLSGSL